MFTQIDRIERQLRVGSSYPVSDDAISPNSFVTGRGLQELLSSVDLNVKEYQLSLKTAMEELDYKRLEMDEALNGQTKNLWQVTLMEHLFLKTINHLMILVVTINKTYIWCYGRI